MFRQPWKWRSDQIHRWSNFAKFLPQKSYNGIVTTLAYTQFNKVKFCNFEAYRHVLNKKEKKEEKRRVGIAIGELSSCSKWQKENVKNKVTDEMKNGNYFRAKMHGIVHKYNHYRFREVNTEIIFARNWNNLMSRNSESEAWAHYLQLKWGHVKIVWFLLRC